MPKTPACAICDILKYQNFAFEAKHRYQIRHFLGLSEANHNKILKSDELNDLHFCSAKHLEMAIKIVENHNSILELLHDLNQKQLKIVLKELSTLAYEHAEAVIMHGLNSKQANATAERLEGRRKILTARRRQKSQFTM